MFPEIKLKIQLLAVLTLLFITKPGKGNIENLEYSFNKALQFPTGMLTVNKEMDGKFIFKYMDRCNDYCVFWYAFLMDCLGYSDKKCVTKIGYAYWSYPTFYAINK